MHLDLADTGPAAVLIAPAPGVRALALFLDGEFVEVLDDPIDVADHVAHLPTQRIGGPRAAELCAPR